MTTEKRAIIHIVLDAEEEALLVEAKEKSGIRSSSELVRFLLTAYTSKSFVPPSLRVTND